MTHHAPVILIGMHRSGTSMLTRMLEACGLFVGSHKETNYEALFFLKLNEWLLQQSGGRWDYPAVVDSVLDQPPLRALVIDYFRVLLGSRHAWSYTGVARALRGERPLRMASRWGWKDPRSTFTLPLWLDIFPDARVLHLYRNGIDVANSLRQRVVQDLKRSETLHARRRRLQLYQLRKKQGRFVGSPRCLSLSGGFSLWEEHVTRAFGYEAVLGGQLLHIRFEDLTATPSAILPAIVEFCGLRPSADQLEAAIGPIRRDRSNAYRTDVRLSEFARMAAESKWMQRLGYV